MDKKVLITGGFGFLGRATAQYFKHLGYKVFGLGNDRWAGTEAQLSGFDYWSSGSVTQARLTSLNQKFDAVIHCAGNGSVGFAQNNPGLDFAKTVESTVEVLEYLRLENPGAHLIYPSSAGVYGEKDNVPIKESDPLTPCSTYGLHKKIVESLCGQYSNAYGLKISIIRFFSVYGNGLTKQLLWDAAQKLSKSEGQALFWGTGQETRDWIHISDAVKIIGCLIDTSESFKIINGGSGRKTPVSDVIHLLREALDVQVEVAFNGATRVGDPRFYQADINQLSQTGFRPSVNLEDGIIRYAHWYKNL